MLSNLDTLHREAISLLQKLISTPSYSKEENKTADIIEHYLTQKGIKTYRKLNNVWAYNFYFDPQKPTILLNSHHDTVKPNSGYTRAPFEPSIENGKLYGLGSNDAGGCLVSLIQTFIYFYNKPNMAYNLLLAATAEEEISGQNGIESIWEQIQPISFAIVGEPTLMNMAIAEKGLMVVDCTAIGKAGHAARDEGVNAIYIAIEDINWIKNYKFEKISELLGPVKMTVSIINAGSQHNVIPDKCQFTIDIRVTDAYKNEEILEILKQHLKSEIKPRSVRLKPSSIAKTHPIVTAGLKLSKKTFASPTTSDQALMDCPSLKIGPGDSARSHSADEFIYVDEIKSGIADYILMLNDVLLNLHT
jgi:acetylornithine deacetylase